MTQALVAHGFQVQLEQLDALIREVEHFADSAAQAHTRALVQALLELHGTGLASLLEHVGEAGEAGQRILAACVGDPVVSGLLLLHGLHPLDLETRVRQALEEVRPYLRSHGGNIELLRIDEGVIRLRLHGSCHSCPSSAVTMEQTIKEAILGKAPEVLAVEVEGLAHLTPPTTEQAARLALPVL
jgi:Fe-S cluster biogenesis protein NfuA